jgi:hypothetical protein
VLWTSTTRQERNLGGHTREAEVDMIQGEGPISNSDGLRAGRVSFL